MSCADYSVSVRQEPVAARACGSADRPDRRPIDPIVILQLKDRENAEIFTDGATLSFFCIATLFDASEPSINRIRDSKSPSPIPMSNPILTGTTLSSIFYLKENRTDRQTGAFFVFADLNVRSEGTYKFRFDVFRMLDARVFPVAHCISKVFTVYSAKRFPGMTNSTELSKIFSDQGLKIRIRKDVRARKTKAEPIKTDRHVLAVEPSTSLELGLDKSEALYARHTAIPNSRAPEESQSRRSASPKLYDSQPYGRSFDHYQMPESPSYSQRSAGMDNRLYSQRHVSLVDSDVRSPPSNTHESREEPRDPWPSPRMRLPVSSGYHQRPNAMPPEPVPALIQRSSSEFLNCDSREEAARPPPPPPPRGSHSMDSEHRGHFLTPHHQRLQSQQHQSSDSSSSQSPNRRQLPSGSDLPHRLPSFNEAFPNYASHSSSSLSGISGGSGSRNTIGRHGENSNGHQQEQGKQAPRSFFPPPPLPRDGL